MRRPLGSPVLGVVMLIAGVSFSALCIVAVVLVIEVLRQLFSHGCA